MAKASESTAAQLAAAQDKLKAAHAKLVAEFEKLHHEKFDAASHRQYLEKLKAHLQALEAPRPYTPSTKRCTSNAGPCTINTRQQLRNRKRPGRNLVRDALAESAACCGVGANGRP